MTGLKIARRFRSDIRKPFYTGDNDALELSRQPVEFRLKEFFEKRVKELSDKNG